VTYLLRNIPDDLWVRVRQRAASEGRSLRFVILKLLEHYVRHGLKLP
jgi:plasmid stability protein